MVERGCRSAGTREGWVSECVNLQLAGLYGDETFDRSDCVVFFVISRSCVVVLLGCMIRAWVVARSSFHGSILAV